MCELCLPSVFKIFSNLFIDKPTFRHFIHNSVWETCIYHNITQSNLYEVYITGLDL